MRYLMLVAVVIVTGGFFATTVSAQQPALYAV
jgi:hypothetical protein